VTLAAFGPPSYASQMSIDAPASAMTRSDRVMRWGLMLVQSAAAVTALVLLVVDLSWGYGLLAFAFSINAGYAFSNRHAAIPNLAQRLRKRALPVWVAAALVVIVVWIGADWSPLAAVAIVVGLLAWTTYQDHRTSPVARRD
jgi:hypothetical protein